MANKEVQIGIRCTNSQYEQWLQAAELDRRTLTDWIRIQLDDNSAEQIRTAEEKPKS